MMFGSLAEVELGAASTGAGARLQTALVALGKIVGNGTLSAVKVDGAPGAKTAVAASLAFTKYVTGAPAAYKKLTTARVKTTAAALAALIEGEIRRRGGTVPAPATVAKAQITKKGRPQDRRQEKGDGEKGRRGQESLRREAKGSYR
jgi:hypothetical protein